MVTVRSSWFLVPGSWCGDSVPEAPARAARHQEPGTRNQEQPRSGFTLIELLVVIVIIMILSGLILTAVNMITDSSKRTQTETVFTAIQQGLRLSMAERGSLPQPTEHPMAGSKAPRPVFVRSGATLATTGEALSGVSADQVIAAVRPRLLDPDDIYGEPDLPLLYGLERRHIGVLGALRSDITAYRWLALPSGATVVPEHPDAIDNDYTTADYADKVHLVPQAPPAPQTTAADNRAHIEFFLGSGSLDELARLGALHEAPTSGDILGGRLVAEPDQITEGRWEPGGVRIADGTWTGYRLPGLAIYDAWGREVLYALRDGQIALLSAGQDGVFAIDPGEDAEYDLATDPLTGEFGGDDRDGRKDNVGVGQ